MVNVLILTLVFPPDSVSTAQIMGHLATDLDQAGHRVTVLSTSPHYNRDPEAEATQPLYPFWGGLLRQSNYNGIRVLHAAMPKKGSNVFLRVIAWMGFHFISTVAGIVAVQRPHVIIVPSPPLTIGISAWLLSLFHRAPYIYNVQEIYPDIVIRLGTLRNRFLINALFDLERFVYRHATKVTVIAPRMRDSLLKKGVLEEKVVVVPNFVDIEDLQPAPKDNSFSRRYGVNDKFVVSYAGNLGPAQGLSTYLEAAVRLADQPGIRFMMMGDGILRDQLRRQAGELGLDNLIFLPHQPYSLVPQIYATSDVNLVPQAAETGFDAVPSKVYRIMACARPVIAVTDSSSDLAQLIVSAQCGLVVPPGCADKLAEAVMIAHRDRDRWQQMGESGRRYVVERYARKVITGRYHDLILAAVREQNRK